MKGEVTTETPLVQLGATGEYETAEKAALVLLTGPQAGRTYPFADRVTVGRGPECEVVIDAHDVSRMHARITRTGQGHASLLDLGSRNGTFVNGLRVTEQPIKLGDRISIGTSAVLLFTHRDRLEENLLHQQRMEAIGRLAGGIAHDFNNLLGAVLGNCSVLMRSRPDVSLGSPEVAEMLTDIRTAAQRACELTQQLLLFARRGDPELRPTDLSRLTIEVVRMCRRTFPANIEVTTDIAPDMIVLGDPSQLHQVVMNLLINARDAMPKGGKLRIVVEASPVGLTRGGPTPWARIAIADTGIGMDAATRERAFEPFFTTKTPGEGTGLGLATVYGIVTSHGGEIGIQSEEGSGTTFEVFLPQKDREQRSMAPTPGPTELPNIGARATVLVVDDEDLYLRSSARILEECGHNVLLARNGVEAVEVFTREHHRIRLVLLDLVMPQMGGEETCRALRAIDSSVKVLFVSGYRPAELEDLDQSCADGFLGKPFDIAALERATHALLSK